jgi:hypothetical protein
MSWEDSDDDWEKTELKLPGAGGSKDDETWSDEEGHQALTEEEKIKSMIEEKTTGEIRSSGPTSYPNPRLVDLRWNWCIPEATSTPWS